MPAPGVAEGLHLLGLAGQVVEVAVLHVARGGRPLEVRVEADAVGRVDVDRLHLPAQALALGERGHHREAVAEDHPVRPLAGVAVELDLGLAVVVGRGRSGRRGRGRRRCGGRRGGWRAGPRSAPWGGSAPGGRSAGPGRSGRTSRRGPCRARRAAGRGRGRGGPRRCGRVAVGVVEDGLELGGRDVGAALVVDDGLDGAFLSVMRALRPPRSSSRWIEGRSSSSAMRRHGEGRGARRRPRCRSGRGG